MRIEAKAPGIDRDAANQTVRSMPGPPFLERVSIIEDRVPSFEAWPFSLPYIRNLALEFKAAVTFFVGENGSGKSTLLEAIVQRCGLPVSGGGKTETADRHGPENGNILAPALRASFIKRPKDGFFVRAEFLAHFASLLEQREADPDFAADPYSRYGGRSLHTRSHGEAFLALVRHRIQSGVILMDEPESALSPQRQLSLLTLMADMVRQGNVQFIIATHSPILLTFPDADIVTFDRAELPLIRLEDTSHFQITRDVLASPKRFWRHLLDDGSNPAG
jgi:predicted ATPase